MLGDDYEDLRKAVTEHNLRSIFRLLGDDYEDLRKAITENNLHSLFRLLGNDYEDLRKAVTEKNLNSMFRMLGPEYDDLRKAVTDKNLYSLFRLVEQNETTEDLRKALIESNEMSLFRLIEDKSTIVEDLKKASLYKNIWSIKRIDSSVTDEVNLTMENSKHSLWRVLQKHTDSSLIKPLEILDKHNIEYDKDVLSRGQLKSKKWLVDKLAELDLYLGNIFLCAGWYASIVPLMKEANLKFSKVRSFDIDPEVWKIAEIFNADLLNDDWKFKATTQDIFDIDFNEHKFDTLKTDGTTAPLTEMCHTVINTSCEHIENFAEWYAKIPSNKIVILQSNDYFSIEEHVNCSKDLKEFSESAPMERVLYEGALNLGEYRRFMKIGYK